MWKIIYNFLAHLALPVFVLYGLTQKKIRKNLCERLFVTTVKTPLKDALWIHAASVGEAAISENLIRYMRKYTNLLNFVITTNTYYTKDMLKTKFGSDIPVFSLPLDLSYLVSRFIGASQFKALVIIETEIWPNLIWQAEKKHIPVIIVNGRISDRSITTYRRFSPFLSHVLNHVEHVAAQSNKHKERFISIGMNPQKVTNTGNIKYFRILSENDNITQKENILTFGSIKEKELDIILPVITSLKNDLQDTIIYIAPREIHLTSIIEEKLSKFFNVARFSTIKAATKGKIDIIVVDTMGDLMGIYEKSMVAFVGGSLAPYGGQNILEPLFFGTPVIFGPYMENFRDIADIVLENKAGVMVDNGNDLSTTMKNIMSDASLQREMGKAGRLIIQKQQDVMKKTVDVIMNAIEAGNRP
jgi:3-deoxy-D-manno-octulosonic-acid transferase